MAALMRRRDSTSQIAESPDVSASALNLSSSAMPMEKMKKRKAYDKERRLALKSSKDEENSEKQKTYEVVVGDQSSNPLETTLPVTTAAAEMLVSELVEVQRAYEEISDKQEVKSGSMLEAEKDDGLDGCETSVRLASKPFKKKKAIAILSKKKRSSALNRYKMIVSLAQNSTHWILKIVDACKLSESEHDKVLEVFQNAVVAYFDSKKSQIKPEFLSEVFKRRPWVGHRLFGFLLKRCREAKSGYRRVDSLDLLFGTLKSLLSDSADSSSKKILKTHLAQISDVVQILVKNMPEKQAKRAAVRKFCNKILQIVSTHEIAKAFLKTLDEESQNACEVQLGETFLSLKKT
ncbi:hypothetical protein V2J09_001342 [Rumex salicifolius]